MYDAIVIGGGFAGLSAAVRLAGAGLKVLVLEARPALGGRASSFSDPATGEIVDNGQHLLAGCYRETLAFLGAVGAADRVRLQQELEVTFVTEGGRETTLRCPPLPSPYHLSAGVLEWDALAPRDRLSILSLTGSLRVARRRARGLTGQLAASPGETVESWLVRNGQSERLRAMLWEPFALASLNQSPRVAAAPPFARVLGEMFGPDRRDSALGWPTVGLSDLYVEPARAYIEGRGGRVEAGAPARVVLDESRGARVEARGTQRLAGAVIAAVPWFALPALFIGDTSPLATVTACAAATAASPVLTVNLWFDRPVLDVPFVGLPGRAMQWVFDRRQMIGDRASHLSLVSSGAADAVASGNDEVVRLALDLLLAALPRVRDGRLLRASVVRERRATFSLAPGQPSRPPTRTAVPGLFLAGDWIDTGLPATIESAVASGHRAAAEVLS